MQHLPLLQCCGLLCACSISIKGIKAHPWYNTRMRPHFEEALEQLGKAQAQADEKVW